MAQKHKKKVVRILELDKAFDNQVRSFIERKRKENGTISSFAQMARIALFELMNKK